jgi:hypothetical protein
VPCGRGTRRSTRARPDAWPSADSQPEALTASSRLSGTGFRLCPRRCWTRRGSAAAETGSTRPDGRDRRARRQRNPPVPSDLAGHWKLIGVWAFSGAMGAGRRAARLFRRPPGRWSSEVRGPPTRSSSSTRSKGWGRPGPVESCAVTVMADAAHHAPTGADQPSTSSSVPMSSSRSDSPVGLSAGRWMR